MRKPLKKPNKRSNRFQRSTLTTVLVVAAILAIAAVTVVSRQQSRTRKVAKKSDSATVKVVQQDVEVDRQTGQKTELTAEEARKMAGGLKQMVNQSTEGLVEVRHADGSVSVNLEDRFQNVTVARVNKDGSVAQSCVDNPKAAGAFFGIDPKLIDPTVDTRSRRARVSPVGTNN